MLLLVYTDNYIIHTILHHILFMYIIIIILRKHITDLES